MDGDKSIVDLGEISGRLLFFGGVYSNLQSLQALQQWAVDNHYLPENIFCTGDILGYCAQPAECISLIRHWGIRSIAGNVELQVREGLDDCGCNFQDGGRCDTLSKNWYAYIRQQVSATEIEWLHGLPHHIRFRFGGKQVTILHGSWFNTAEFIFRSTPRAVKQQNFEATVSDIIVAGHAGLPFADEYGGRLWLNAGVVGMPANDGTDRVWFATMAHTEGVIACAFHAYRYDNIEASRLMQATGLPKAYADTLLTGIWDNCEILPPEETRQQGIRLVI